MTSNSVTKHLSRARRDIAAGTASFRSAADHIAAAVKAGATQAEAAQAVGKSQSWVNRLLKWRENGFTEAGPFDADHARAIISGANNPATARTVPMGATYENLRPVAPYTGVSVPESAQSKVVHLNVTSEQKAPVDASEEVAAALPLEVKLTRLEQAAIELTPEIELRGGIVGAGEEAERRIMAVANSLWSLADRSPVRRLN